MNRKLLLTLSHAAALAVGLGAGVALGIYLLPILAAPPGPTASELQVASQGMRWQAQFKRDLKGSDTLHWGEGQVTVSERAVTFQGRMAPGPAYRLYLVPKFVETEEEFLRVKAQSLMLGDIKTFDGFIVPLPAGGVPLERYDTVLVWCEAFKQFITAARYR